jgi:hypothetical protein
LLIEWVHVIGKGCVCLDGLTRLLVDVTGEGVALFGRLSLLVTRLPAVILGEWGHRTRSLSVMCFEIPLVDTPATARRDVRVVGLDRVLLESAVTRKVTCVLAEDPLVEVGVNGHDPGPVFVTALSGRPLQ